MLLAGVILGKLQYLPVAFARYYLYLQIAARIPERRFNGVGKAGAQTVLHHKAVNDHVDVVLFILFKLYLFRQLVHIPADLHAGVAVLLCIGKNLFVSALLPAHNGREHHKARALLKRHYAVDYGIRGLHRYLLAAHGAMRNTDACVKKTEVIVYLRDRAHGGARVL